MRVILTFFATTLILFSLLSTITFLFLDIQPQQTTMEDKEIHIKKGMSASMLAQELHEAKLIRSVPFFKLLTRISGLDKKLKSGYLAVSTGTRTTELIKQIIRSDFIKISFTIPEGYSEKEIHKLLLSKNIVSEEQIASFITSPSYTDPRLSSFKTREGFLFPETYTFLKGVSIHEIYATLTKQFFLELSSIYPAWQKLSNEEFYQKIILASIIEKEVKNHAEAPIVSGIFYNRIAQNMKLQSCATVQYILDKPKERLLFEDLEIINPYNTYVYKGLPPTPIANPGRNALKAAFYPSKNNYLYFVVKDPQKGLHHFSSNYQEHLRAQEKYKALQGFQ